MLTVSLLVCAVMALTRAAAVPEAEPGNGTGPLIQAVKSHMVKRSLHCPSSWTETNTRCYVYVPTLTTWADAQRHCQEFGASLASVHSLNEMDLIQRIILRVTGKFPVTWIGGSDAAQEGSWFWSDGSPFTFNYWATGQPNNNHGHGHCMTMNFGVQKKFDDMPCSSRNPSFCAMKSGFTLDR